MPYISIVLAMIVMVLQFVACTPSSQAPFPATYLEELTIPQLQLGYQQGRYTIKQVVADYISRINAIDKRGPKLNSVIVVNPDALQIAEALDREWQAGRFRGPMHGIPVIIKDNIDTHDKMPNTAGSLALKNSLPLQDSYIVKKLRDAGAVIIAKANLSEWANFRAETSSSGWSGVGGQTNNPYVLDRNPCGSSSGSAVAVSANLCMMAIGTETNGSIVCPSNNNGIVGLKPTVGLLSRSGIIPISFTQDTPGPMGRTVEDVAICLGVLTGLDSTDTKTLASRGHSHSDYSRFLRKDGVKGKRIGLVTDALGFSVKVDTLIRAVAAHLVRQGATVIEVESPQGHYEEASYQVLLYEFKDGLNRYLRSLGANAPIRSLADLIAFNKTDSLEMRFFDQKILEAAEAKGGLDTGEYQEALATMLKSTREQGIDKLMDEHRLDALLAPTGSPAWKTDLILGDHFVGGSSSLAAISGYPAITVPAGFVEALPVGVTFFGKAWSEPLLLEIAYSFEQASRLRKKPQWMVSL